MSAAFTREELAHALAVTIPEGAALRYSAVSTDTRTLVPGSLFVALLGDHFDGHDHLLAAHRAGAAGALVRRGTAAVEGLPLWEVEDPLVSLGDLAAYHRRRFSGPVIAITGQNGKTSTKEMVAAVMTTRWKTHRTKGNLNNLIGVPLTVLEAPNDTEALVVEAGANLPGEIARFRDILRPDIAIVTSAGSGHLAGFGSVAGVVREKLSLTLDVPLAIVGTSPVELKTGAQGRTGRVLSAGLAGADVIPDAVVLQPDGSPLIRIDEEEILLAARGMHQAGNAMFAWALVRHFQLDRLLAARALEKFVLPGGRGELNTCGELTILNDSYNANPESFRSAMELARSLRTGRRLVFIAGSMRELGEQSDRLHREVAAELACLKPELLVLTGDFVRAFDGLRAGYPGQLLEATDADSVGPLLAEALEGNELVILKGSRGATLERIIPFINQRILG